MKYAEITQTIVRIDRLIRMRATGTPNELCQRLRIARSTWFEIKKIMMEEYQCPIAYCKYRQSYYYTEEGCFKPAGFKKKSELQDD